MNLNLFVNHRRFSDRKNVLKRKEIFDVHLQKNVLIWTKDWIFQQ